MTSVSMSMKQDRGSVTIIEAKENGESPSPGGSAGNIIYGFVDLFKNVGDVEAQCMYEINQPVISIGRDHKCNIRINNLRISRHQCDLIQDEKVKGRFQAVLYNKTDRLTTFVDGKEIRVGGKVQLLDGARFKVFEVELRWRRFDPKNPSGQLDPKSPTTVLKLLEGGEFRSKKRKAGSSAATARSSYGGASNLNNSSSKSSRRRSNDIDMRKAVLQRSFRKSVKEKSVQGSPDLFSNESQNNELFKEKAENEIQEISTNDISEDRINVSSASANLIDLNSRDTSLPGLDELIEEGEDSIIGVSTDVIPPDSFLENETTEFEDKDSNQLAAQTQLVEDSEQEQDDETQFSDCLSQVPFSVDIEGEVEELLASYKREPAQVESEGITVSANSEDTIQFGVEELIEENNMTIEHSIISTTELIPSDFYLEDNTNDLVEEDKNLVQLMSPQSVEDLDEDPDSVEDLIQEPDAVDVLDEEPDIVEDLIQEPDAVDVLDEEPVRVEDLIEEPEAVDIMDEEPDTVEDLIQESDAVDVLDEEPVRVEDLIEEPEAVDVLDEEPVIVEDLVEEPDAVDVLDEEPVTVEDLIEEPDVVDVLDEEPVTVEDLIEEPDAVDVLDEEPVTVEDLIEEPDAVDVLDEEAVTVEDLVEEPDAVDVLDEKPDAETQFSRFGSVSQDIDGEAEELLASLKPEPTQLHPEVIEVSSDFVNTTQIGVEGLTDENIIMNRSVISTTKVIPPDFFLEDDTNSLDEQVKDSVQLTIPRSVEEPDGETQFSDSVSQVPPSDDVEVEELLATNKREPTQLQPEVIEVSSDSVDMAEIGVEVLMKENISLEHSVTSTTDVIPPDFSLEDDTKSLNGQGKNSVQLLSPRSVEGLDEEPDEETQYFTPYSTIASSKPEVPAEDLESELEEFIASYEPEAPQQPENKSGLSQTEFNSIFDDSVYEADSNVPTENGPDLKSTIANSSSDTTTMPELKLEAAETRDDKTVVPEKSVTELISKRLLVVLEKLQIPNSTANENGSFVDELDNLTGNSFSTAFTDDESGRASPHSFEIKLNRRDTRMRVSYNKHDSKPPTSRPSNSKEAEGNPAVSDKTRTEKISHRSKSLSLNLQDTSDEIHVTNIVDTPTSKESRSKSTKAKENLTVSNKKTVTKEKNLGGKSPIQNLQDSIDEIPATNALNSPISRPVRSKVGKAKENSTVSKQKTVTVEMNRLSKSPSQNLQDSDEEVIATNALNSRISRPVRSKIAKAQENSTVSKQNTVTVEKNRRGKLPIQNLQDSDDETPATNAINTPISRQVRYKVAKENSTVSKQRTVSVEKNRRKSPSQTLQDSDEEVIATNALNSRISRPVRSKVAKAKENSTVSKQKTVTAEKNRRGKSQTLNRQDSNDETPSTNAINTPISRQVRSKEAKAKENSTVSKQKTVSVEKNRRGKSPSQNLQDSDDEIIATNALNSRISRPVRSKVAKAKENSTVSKQKTVTVEKNRRGKSTTQNLQDSGNEIPAKNAINTPISRPVRSKVAKAKENSSVSKQKTVSVENNRRGKLPTQNLQDSGDEIPATNALNSPISRPVRSKVTKTKENSTVSSQKTVTVEKNRHSKYQKNEVLDNTRACDEIEDQPERLNPDGKTVARKRGRPVKEPAVPEVASTPYKKQKVGTKVKVEKEIENTEILPKSPKQTTTRTRNMKQVRVSLVRLEDDSDRASLPVEEKSSRKRTRKRTLNEKDETSEDFPPTSSKSKKAKTNPEVKKPPLSPRRLRNRPKRKF